jgi:hypothetical protein
MGRWLALEEVVIDRCEATCRADAEKLFALLHPGRRIRAQSVLSWEQQARDENAVDRNKQQGYKHSADDDDEKDCA